ncbi:MAG TPA: hypothetical protein VJ951_14310 [Bacteroidales bacterium]|nr:hypothetical protein [Bacteroidales bacterium]
MKKVISIIIVLASVCLLSAKSQTIGWLGISSKQVKSEIEQMFQMEEKAIEQEIMNFEQSGNWMNRTNYLEETASITNQELTRRFQVIRNEERMLYDEVNNILEPWMFDVYNWTLEDNLEKVWEDPFLMSEWMFDDDFWKLCRVENEECIELEDWMFESRFFAIEKGQSSLAKE